MLYNRIWGAVYLCFGLWHFLHRNSLLKGEARLDSPRSPLGNSLLLFKGVECSWHNLPLQKLTQTQPAADTVYFFIHFWETGNEHEHKTQTVVWLYNFGDQTLSLILMQDNLEERLYNTIWNVLDTCVYTFCLALCSNLHPVSQKWNPILLNFQCIEFWVSILALIGSTVYKGLRSHSGHINTVALFALSAAVVCLLVQNIYTINIFVIYH